MATLDTLPTEIHLLIKSHLDPISSTCLALTCPTLYNTSVVPTTTLTAPTSKPTTPLPTPLNFRPRPVLSRTPSANPSGTSTPALEAPTSMAGATGYFTPSNASTQHFVLDLPSICRHCRSTRCSLHNHIESWVGSDFEFCSVRSKFVRVSAGDDSSSDDGSESGASSDGVSAAGRPSCWRSCPPRPGRCGRHGEMVVA